MLFFQKLQKSAKVVIINLQYLNVFTNVSNCHRVKLFVIGSGHEELMTFTNLDSLVMLVLLLIAEVFVKIAVGNSSFNRNQNKTS